MYYIRHDQFQIKVDRNTSTYRVTDTIAVYLYLIDSCEQFNICLANAVRAQQNFT